MRSRAPLIGISAEQAPVVRYWGTEDHHVVDADYVAAVRAVGGVPVVLPVGGPPDTEEVLHRLDGLVLTGGDDVGPDVYGQARLEAGTGGNPDPARDRFDLALARGALALGLPTLAICRGLQIVNVALGGTLVQHLVDHPTTSTGGDGGHAVELVASSAFARRFGALRTVNSLHHQAIDRPGNGVVVVAVAPDGTAEAVEVDGADAFVGVQWHPELLMGRAEHRALFEWLVGS